MAGQICGVIDRVIQIKVHLVVLRPGKVETMRIYLAVPRPGKVSNKSAFRGLAAGLRYLVAKIYISAILSGYNHLYKIYIIYLKRSLGVL